MRVSLELLRDIFLLPEDVKVEGVVQLDSDVMTGECSIMLSGDGLPEKFSVFEGCWPQTILAKYNSVAVGNMGLRVPEFSGFSE